MLFFSGSLFTNISHNAFISMNPFTGKYELTIHLAPNVCQLVGHCTGIVEVMGSNPVEALKFFRLLSLQFLSMQFCCMDHFHYFSLVLLVYWSFVLNFSITVSFKLLWPHSLLLVKHRSVLLLYSLLLLLLISFEK